MVVRGASRIITETKSIKCVHVDSLPLKICETKISVKGECKTLPLRLVVKVLKFTLIMSDLAPFNGHVVRLCYSVIQNIIYPIYVVLVGWIY